MKNEEMLILLNEKVKSCNRCKELVENRTQTVLGDGNPKSKIVFLGEAPGKNEDLQGKPFVGRAGQLLNNIIIACGMKREDVYICNILKCRPPGNRTPLPEETQNCRPFLNLQLKIINPKFIVCLGACASQNLLGIKMPMSQMRGQWFEYNGIKVLCTWHPSYGLRVSSAKHEIYKDLMLLVEELKKSTGNSGQ